MPCARSPTARDPPRSPGGRAGHRRPIRSLDEACSALAARLRERLPELEAAVSTRVYAISDPHDVADPTYLEDLNAALAAAIDYRLTVLEVGERRAPAVPPVLIAQARLDARDGVPLDTVLRRYFAGNALFGDFLVEEAERAEVPSSALRRLLGVQATLGDRLLAAVSAEHAREAKGRPGSAAERRRECVKCLLAGELVDRAELEYDLDAHHLALMAAGEGAAEAMRELAGRLDRRLLAVRREEEPVWACWLGGREQLEVDPVLRALRGIDLEGVLITLGEPGEGLSGWRLSHRQAKAALPIAERGGQALVQYADVTLLASILRDDLAIASLRRLYLEPLEAGRDGDGLGAALSAYFEAGRNVSSAAAALGLNRRTLSKRLQAAERILGSPWVPRRRPRSRPRPGGARASRRELSPPVASIHRIGTPGPEITQIGPAAGPGTEERVRHGKAPLSGRRRRGRTDADLHGERPRQAGGRPRGEPLASRQRRHLPSKLPRTCRRRSPRTYMGKSEPPTAAILLRSKGSTSTSTRPFR